MQLPSGKSSSSAPAQASASDVLTLVDLDDGNTYTFRLFPSEIGLKGRAEWKPQPVVKRPAPLFYSNRAPQELTFPSLWIDRSEERASITADIVGLLDLQETKTGRGSPPALLALWGDATFRCVLTDVTVTEKYFSAEGLPLRAEVTLTLLELQEDEQPAAASAQSPTPTGQVTGGRVFGPEP